MDQREDNITHARKIIDHALAPMLHKGVMTTNVHLEKSYGVRIGVEVNWFIEEVE